MGFIRDCQKTRMVVNWFRGQFQKVVTDKVIGRMIHFTVKDGACLDIPVLCTDILKNFISSFARPITLRGIFEQETSLILPSQPSP